MKQYSEELENIEDPSTEQYCDAKSYISNTLLHDVILMEVRSMTLRSEARKKRMQCERKVKLESRIDEIQNSYLEEDVLELKELKK